MTQPTSLGVTLAPRTAPAAAAAVAARMARSVVIGRLEGIEVGDLTVVDECGTRRFGRPNTGPSATVNIHDPAVWTAIALGGSLGAGESYMDGLWSTDDLVATVRVMLRASSRLSSVDGAGLGLVRGTLDSLYHRFRRNTKTGSRANHKQRRGLISRSIAQNLPAVCRH